MGSFYTLSYKELASRTDDVDKGHLRKFRSFWRMVLSSDPAVPSDVENTNKNCLHHGNYSPEPPSVLQIPQTMWKLSNTAGI